MFNNIIKVLAFCFSLSTFSYAASSQDYEPIAEFQGTIPGNLVQGTTDGFGSSVKLNGKWAFVSAPIARPFNDIVGGAVYVYKKDHHGDYDTTPYQIIALPGVSHHLGLFKVESQDDWLFLSCFGTPVADTGATVGDFKGAVLVYKFSHTSKQWELNQVIDGTTVPALSLLVPISTPALNPTNPPYDNEQGASFGLSFDVDVCNGRMVVGAQYQTTNNSIINVGAVYTFYLDDGVWKFGQELTNPDGITANDTFGSQIAIDGDIALISNGSIFQAARQANSAVYVYVYKDGKWKFRQKIVGDQTNQIPVLYLLFANPVVFIGDTFGSALAIKDGWAIIGSAFENNGTSSAQGAAYFYKIDRHSKNSPLKFKQKVLANDVNPLAQNFSMTSVALKGDYAVISNIAATGPTGVLFQGGANVYKLINHTWQLQTTLFDPAGTNANWFSGGVDIDNKHIFVGAGFQGINQLIVGAPPLAVIPTPPPAQPPFRRAVIFNLPRD